MMDSTVKRPPLMICAPDPHKQESGSTPTHVLTSGSPFPASRGHSPDRPSSSSTGKPTSPAHSVYPEPPTPPFDYTNSDVEAADGETLNIANPFELRIAHRSMGAARTLKSLGGILYLSILLFLPRLYFSRVERILKGAEMSMEDMEHMVVVGLGKWNRKTDRIPVYIQNSHMYPVFMQFSSTWEFFIDSLMNEWRTFNIVSILLSGAILTLLQINTASSDPLIRNCALLSLVCAMMSLLYACMYIVRFAMMRKAHKALEWAEETKITGKVVLWNVWVLLALPAIWLSWSLILFMTSVMAFVWRIGGQDDPIADVVNNCGRILISGVFVVGMIYLTLVLITLRTYGGAMDAKWRERVEQWTQKHRAELMFSKTLPPPGPNNQQLWNSQQLPPAGAYTPVYVAPTQLPFGWAQAVNQPQHDLQFWQIPRDGAMNGGAYTPFIPSQPVDEIQDYSIDLQSPTDPGSASHRSSPVHEDQHCPATWRSFQHNLPLPPESDTISINASNQGLGPLTSFPDSSYPPLDGTSTVGRTSPLHEQSRRCSPPRPINDQLRSHDAWDFPSHGAETAPLASQEPVPYSPHAGIATPSTPTVQVSTLYPNYPHSGATPVIEMEPLPAALCHHSHGAFHTPQLFSHSTPDLHTGIPTHLPTVYEPGDIERAHIETAHEPPGQRDRVVREASGGAGHSQTIMQMVRTFRGCPRQDVGQPGPSHVHAIRPYCTRSAASILGNIGMGYGHPSLAATRDETHLGNSRSRE